MDRLLGDGTCRIELLRRSLVGELNSAEDIVSEWIAWCVGVPDHDEDGVHASLSNCRCYCLHHWPIAEVHMEVGRCEEFKVVEEGGHVEA